jgi:adenosylmethionine-8-amino-7-oxononanoate aminotransferase
VTRNADELRQLARAHLAPHMTAADVWRSDDLLLIARGEGCFVFDESGHRFLDASSGLFCVNIGHGRADIAQAASKQIESLAYTPNWSAAHEPGIEAATFIASVAPGDLDVVFFVNSGSEANESALKFVRQYHRAQGQPDRYKVIARSLAYHGTTMGALSLTGIGGYKEPFGPMLPGVLHVPNTLGASVPAGGSARDLPCVQAIEEVIEREGAETIAALFAEPVQNSGGALVPPQGYWQALRAICDRHGILLVADEVVTGFGRIGHWFGSERFGVVPDLLTFAKGATSGYAPLGGMVVRRPVMEALLDVGSHMFTHGATWGGHPVSTSISLANMTAIQNEHVLDNVVANSSRLQAGLMRLHDEHRIVKAVRGTGYLYAVTLMADRETGVELTPEQCLSLATDVFPPAMRRSGLLVRFFERGGFTIVVSPPLIADAGVLDEIVDGLDGVLREVGRHVQR